MQIILISTRPLFVFADLLEQALAHALKGRGILLAPGGHMTSRDQHPQAILSLALTHCIIGRVFTTQGKYPVLI